ncbi:MAG: DUF1844 domain-containing protein [bacterium]|nr:DUF1844 domain-containing protein [bacterium]
MSSEESKENQGFKVSDHRRFNPDGSPKNEAESAPEVPKAAPPTESETPPEPPGEEAGPDSLPADFPTLVLSLASSAQMAMGVAPNPMTGKTQKNLLQAKHAIDLLGVLQEKTKGNLTEEEDKLLQALLTDLRMRFMEVKKEGL